MDGCFDVLLVCQGDFRIDLSSISICSVFLSIRSAFRPLVVAEFESADVPRSS